MKKIVITGGLGYLGTELCRLYSGVSWKNRIVVIDNRFFSEIKANNNFLCNSFINIKDLEK